MPRRIGEQTKPELDLGVDPGKVGGYVTAWDGEKIRGQWPIPWLADEPDIDATLKLFRVLKKAGAVHATLEHQQTFGKEGAKSAFTAGGGYIALKIALRIAEIPFEEPTPQEWKKFMGVPSTQAKLPPLPKKPAKPKLPKRNRTKGQKKLLADWKVAMIRWTEEVEPVEKARNVARRKAKGKRKDASILIAKQLVPGHDFRKNKRCKGPHDGKCESLLLAVHSRRKRKGD